jgi:hypothetical protein
MTALQRQVEKFAPRMTPHHRRILEAILYLINEAERRDIYVTEFDIDKTIWLADVAHLNKYGRPITFDNYAAMKDGPVPSFTRDALQPEFDSARYYIEAWPPWDRVRSPADGDRAYKFINPKREPNLRVLSATDLDELNQALTLVKSKGFHQLRKYTHEHPAYKDVWPKDAPDGRYWMDYNKLLDQPDPEVVEDLEFSSKHM